VLCRAFVFLLTCTLLLALTDASAKQASASSAGLCATAESALERGQLEEARTSDMDVLAADPQAQCAVEGLGEVTHAVRAEERLCQEGDNLAKGREAQQVEARQRYAAAMQKNGASSCASKGLGLAAAGGTISDEKNGLAHTEEDVSNFFTILGKVLVAIVVLIGLIALARSLWRRWRKPSLAVEAFADSAVDVKVGSAVATLTEKRLVELSRRGRRLNDPYSLDVAVADIELVAENQGLATAMGGLAEESQFKLVAAVLGLIDKYVGTHLTAKGELAPKGGNGHGVLLALQSEGSGLQASAAFWNPKEVEGTDGKETDPSPYYELADEAASWLQFEVACILDDRVGLITTNAKSFTALVQGIQMQRAEQTEAAAEYYAQALLLDPENVVALFNLSGIVARLWGRYDVAVLLLIRAGAVLERRYEESE
jgi:tetratricopeptide (TPR) repeat protein